MKTYQIPEGLRTSKGRNIVNLINLPEGEEVNEILAIPSNLENHYLIIATENGTVKKTELDEYKNIKQNGLKALKLVDGDKIVAVRVTDGKKDILLCSSSGKSIRFPEEDCRPLGRVSQGVKGITLDEKEKVIGMEIIDDTVEILAVTENGYGKRTQANEYRQQSRGGKGIMAMKLTDKNGDIMAIKPVSDKDDLMIITNNGQVIRIKISGISLLGRTTQGVRLINLKQGETVVGLEKFLDPDDETSSSENDNQEPKLQ
jgi:DNA gyrase subunit A